MKSVIVALLVIAAVLLALKLLLRMFLRSLVRGWVANRPRAQMGLFILKLRDFVFNNPVGARQMLVSDSAGAVVKKIWEDAKPPPQMRAGEPSLPADGLHVQHGVLGDGRTIAVISLPPPERKGEAYLAAVVFPTDVMADGQPLRAKALTRFFYLNKGSSEYRRETDLCGWTSDGQQRWYNVGAPIDPVGFAHAIEQKLRELKL
jgi:hypothetical protein